MLHVIVQAPISFAITANIDRPTTHQSKKENTLSDNDKEFFEITDEFIKLANSLNEKWPTHRISAALLYAAARYNAFNFYATDGTPSDENEGIAYYCDQYKSMLATNLENFREEYEKNA
jgi:hypothetical protein